MGKMGYLAGVARAPFLLLPVALVAAGAGAAVFLGTFNRGRTALALVGLIAAHIAVNSLNEWSDMRTGIDLQTRRTPFSGGSGVLPSGALPPGAALGLGLVSALVGLAIGIWFLARIGWILLPFLVAGGVFVLGYTDALARIGLGEVAAGLGLGGMAVAGTALVQAGTLERAALAASMPAFFMTFNLLLLNEFPDEAADRAGGRRNLVILLGRRTAAVAYATAALLTPLTIVVVVGASVLPPLALLAAIPSLLLIRPLRWALAHAQEEVPIPALAANVGWNLLTNLVLGGALAIAAVL